jgi:hypothetical protein
VRTAAATLAIAILGCAGGKGESRAVDAAIGVAPDPDLRGAGPDAGSTAIAIADAASETLAPDIPAAADFTAEAKLLFRIAACGASDEPLPDHVDAAVVERHCKAIRKAMDRYRDRYFVGGRAFFDELVPDDAPGVVVYPFGGGDLISALAAFPDATEITTISLELSGDPRRITTLDRAALERSLSALRVELGGTLQVGSNTSENLSASQDNDLPAQVSSFLMGLAAGGYEPIGMRYLQLADDGSIDYLDADEIAVIDARAKARRRKGTWTSPNFSEAFAHVEIRYRKRDDPSGVVRVHRHFGWNLGDDVLTREPQLLRHLEAKGKVTMLTKGASYLLWKPSFRMIRDYMLANLTWMLSDSTGIPPAYASAAGMIQDPYGSYTDAFLPHVQGTRHSSDFRKLWQDGPKRKLPFRFGYVDSEHRAHLVVTRPR